MFSLKVFENVIESLRAGSRGEQSACHSGGTIPAAWSLNALGGHSHCLIRTAADLLQDGSVVKLYAILVSNYWEFFSTMEVPVAQS
ncbi:hypothetical protein JMJ77_0001438 [Colletotrichum scovillei]|uniref:Uncharacterized protein n=1 Tax=Colletotrichum scovillei TaxID=1209932 RepID=A0A9P7UFY3_9PEZI|nr:hypothetical protein JMJ77_0001438 [Colletotrichum scovillei]KAG7072662.1 hypothetical protein JMJ76_0005509 [Colletotrichum scovillei]KAG7080974.1 hypothetical protein JMJ78_0008057 [Colletotrichum scovillei]